jgi:hypothetical protein
MQSIVCDVCRKKIDDPMTGRNFFYFSVHSICESCKDNFEGLIIPSVRNKEPFAMDWYSKLVCDSLDKAVQKGRV